MRKYVLSFIFCSIAFLVTAQNKVGIGSKMPTSTLSVEGSIAAGYREITSFTDSIKLQDTDYYVTYNANTKGHIILPEVYQESASLKGRIYKIKNLSNYSLTISASSKEKLRNYTKDVLDIELKPGQYIELICNGQNKGTSTWDISSVNSALPSESSTPPNDQGTWKFSDIYDYTATDPQQVTRSAVDLEGFSKTIVIPANKHAKIVLSYSIPVGSEAQYGYYGITLIKDAQEFQAGSRKTTIGGNRTTKVTSDLTTISATIADNIAASSIEQQVTYSLQSYLQDTNKGATYLMLFGADGYNYNWGKGYWSIMVYLR